MSIINRLIIISTQLALALTITATDLAATDSGVPHRSLSRGRSSRPSSVDSSTGSEEDVSSVAGGGGGGGGGGAADAARAVGEEKEYLSFNQIVSDDTPAERVA